MKIATKSAVIVGISICVSSCERDRLLDFSCASEAGRSEYESSEETIVFRTNSVSNEMRMQWPGYDVDDLAEGFHADAQGFLIEGWIFLPDDAFNRTNWKYRNTVCFKQKKTSDESFVFNCSYLGSQDKLVWRFEYRKGITGIDLICPDCGDLPEMILKGDHGFARPCQTSGVQNPLTRKS